MKNTDFLMGAELVICAAVSLIDARVKTFASLADSTTHKEFEATFLSIVAALEEVKESIRSLRNASELE